jgi:hypothetical protein
VASPKAPQGQGGGRAGQAPPPPPADPKYHWTPPHTSIGTSVKRLDEYLQAMRVGIDIERVNLEIDLTPGVSIARQVTGWIDTNADGQLSQAEAVTYGQQVLSTLALSVDRHAVPLSLVDVQVPSVDDMARGAGTIRLRASASTASRKNGRHQLIVVNSHHPEASVYLANALVPGDASIHIASQQRDREQHELTIDYDVGLAAGWLRMSWLLGALAILAITTVLRRGVGRFTSRQSLRI